MYSSVRSEELKFVELSGACSKDPDLCDASPALRALELENSEIDSDTRIY